MEDIGGGRRRIEREQEDFENGHWVREHLVASAIPSGFAETRSIDRTFDFICPNMPTSFYFRIQLFQDVSCITFLRRTDHGSGAVDVQLRNTIGQFAPEATANHVFRGVRSGRAYADFADSLVAESDAVDSVGRELPLQLQLAVRGCHGPQDMPGGRVLTFGDSEDSRKREATTDTSDSEDSSARKRVCV